MHHDRCNFKYSLSMLTVSFKVGILNLKYSTYPLFTRRVEKINFKFEFCHVRERKMNHWIKTKSTWRVNCILVCGFTSMQFKNTEFYVDGGDNLNVSVTRRIKQTSFMISKVWIFGDIWCSIWLAVDVWMCTASILNLCAISLDRYLAVTRPVSYPQASTHSPIIRFRETGVRACTVDEAIRLLRFLLCSPQIRPLMANVSLRWLNRLIDIPLTIETTSNLTDSYDNVSVTVGKRILVETCSIWFLFFQQSNEWDGERFVTFSFLFSPIGRNICRNDIKLHRQSHVFVFFYTICARYILAG